MLQYKYHKWFTRERGRYMQYFSTIRELIYSICQRFSDRDAFIFKEQDEYQTKLYKEFQQDCDSFAKNLIKRGIHTIHIGLLTKTSYSGLVALFGSIIAGNTVVVPDHEYSIEMMEENFKRTDTFLLVYDSEFEQKAIELKENSQVIEQIISIQELLAQDDLENILLPEVKGDQDAIILFTSGTTGTSKAVVLTNENICANACALVENYDAEEFSNISKLLDDMKRILFIYEELPIAEPKPLYPMSAPQKRMFIVQQMVEDTLAYHIPIAVPLQQGATLSNLKQAMEQMIQRHEILRTKFILFDGVPMQQILDTVTVDVTEKTADGISFEKLLEKFVQPFDLSSGQLLRAQLVHRNNEQYLFFDIHHIISDGISMKQMLGELMESLDGKEIAPIRRQYKDYSQWMAGRDLSAQKAYWISQFDDEIPILNMPTDYKRPSRQSFQGDKVSVETGDALGMKLKELAKQVGVTDYMILLSSAMILLSKYSGQNDIVIGTAVSGRIHKDTEHMLGMFVNTLPFRGRPELDKSYESFLLEMKEVCLHGFANQEYPLEDLIDQLEITRDLSRNPLFDVMVNLHNEESLRTEENLCNTNLFAQHTVSAKFDLTFEIEEQNNNFVIVLEYATALFERTTIQRLCTHFLMILHAITSNPSITIGDISLMTKEEEQRLQIANDTAYSYEKWITIPELWERQVEKTRDRIAVRCGVVEKTYGELNAMANSIAKELRNKGVERDEVIPILCDRSTKLFAGILGILKSGAAYLPMDPEYPAERIQYMMTQSKAKRIVAQESYYSKIPDTMEKIPLELCSHAVKENERIINESKDLAYVIYTSGSTGKPKGVMIEHQQIVNFIHGIGVLSGNLQCQNMLCVTTASFDIFVLESLLPLTNGMTVTLTQNKEDLDGTRIAQLIQENQIDIFQSTPSRYKLLLRNHDFRRALSKVKLAIIGGEALPEDLLNELRTYKQLKIINGYGPTETTIYCSAKDVTDQSEPITIGSPLVNTRYYITDGKNHLLPQGLKGELCIAGDCVGRGYIHAEELTKERFITLENGEHVYRSGDLARMLPNGEFECVGRMDDQVKIRGYRVELGEIEHALLAVKGIEQAAVLAVGENAAKKLCSYYVSKQELNAAWIHQQLEQNLTPYMIPECFIWLKEMPLTPNGKLNRKALPTPEISQSMQSTYQAPRNETEQIICQAFYDTLYRDRKESIKVGIDDDFFRIGGHSLYAVVLAETLRKHFNDYKVTDIFNYRTPRLLALYLLGESDESTESIDNLAQSGVRENVKEMYETDDSDRSHKLPITYPIITSYNHHAHPLAILGCYSESYEWIMSNYIEIYCHKDNIRHSFSDFYFPMFDEVRPPELCPFLQTQKINADMISSMNLDIVDFVCNSIDNRTYVHIMINYYYVEHSKYFNKVNFNHDMLIYGYNKETETLYCSDFVFSDAKKYSFDEISFDALRNGFANCKPDKYSNYLKGQLYLYQLRTNEIAKYKFDMKHILNAMNLYYTSETPEYYQLYDNRLKIEDRAFGLDVYPTLAHYIQEVSEKNEQEIDNRLFYVLYDHKRLMNKRISYLKEIDKDSADAYEQLEKTYQQLEQELKNIVFGIIYFDYKRDISRANRLINKLFTCHDKEKKALGSFLKTKNMK